MDKIEQLQEMLRYLGYVLDEDGLRVAVTGTYNAETERAVRRYQEMRRLPVTGVVDRRTWDTLAAEYLVEQELREPIRLRIPAEPSFGERSDAVLILQIVLNSLRHIYDAPSVPLSGIYDARTSDAVRDFQRINGLEPTGIADRPTWRRLAAEYEGYDEGNF